MRAIKYILLTVIVILGAGCTKQRDLYVVSSPLFVVKADWSKSTLNPHGATALVFNAQKAVLNNPYMQPPTSSQPQRVATDTYDILVFNNLMFSSIDNEFDYITFKGNDKFDTFEAHATMKQDVNALFRSGVQEVYVNNPDVIAADVYRRKTIDDDREFVMKYEDGKPTGNPEIDYVNDEVRVTPIRLTRNVQVILRIKNYKPKFAIYGTLRGFAQGVNLTTRKPVGNNATHAGFIINKAVADPSNADHHILTSDAFTSFGPWWDDALGSNTYTLDLIARYNGQGDVFSYSFNVTKHIENVVTQWVEKAITTIKTEEATYAANGTIPKMETIIIEVWLTLPDVVGGDEGIDVGVEEWGDVVIIPVPIRF